MNADYDVIFILASYLVSIAGSLMALYTMRNAILSTESGRKTGLSLAAAVALGGVGIWAMHFTGMLAMKLEAAVTYNTGLTFLSMLIAIFFVFIGLFAIRHGMPKMGKLIGVGLIVGSGVTAMHYSGMLAMQDVDITWNYTIVALSFVIAVVASIVALWLAANLTKFSHMMISALVMAVAVNGMHYTGMFAATMNVTTANEFSQFENLTMMAYIALASTIILILVGVINAGSSIEIRLAAAKQQLQS